MYFKLVSIAALIFFRSGMDFTALADAKWFALPHFAKMSFSWQAIVFMAPVAIAPIIEHVGDIYAISEIAGKDFIKDPGLHRTMMGDGLACMLAAFLGGAPVTTYSEVTGAVSLTKATDPACMRIAAISAIIVSLIGKVGAAIQTIPQAVLGGIMLLLFGSIAAVGINNMVKAKIDMNKTRNLIIASIILTVGIGGAVISFGKFSLAGIGLALAFRHLIKKLDKKTILYGSVLALLIAGNIIFEKLALDNLPASAVWPLASSLATVWKYSKACCPTP